MDRGGMFGGKFQGPQSRILMRKAMSMLPKIGGILKEAENRNGYLADDENIDDLIEKKRRVNNWGLFNQFMPSIL
jgi:hypothetical protein